MKNEWASGENNKIRSLVDICRVGRNDSMREWRGGWRSASRIKGDASECREHRVGGPEPARAQVEASAAFSFSSTWGSLATIMLCRTSLVRCVSAAFTSDRWMWVLSQVGCYCVEEKLDVFRQTRARSVSRGDMYLTSKFYEFFNFFKKNDTWLFLTQILL